MFHINLTRGFQTVKKLILSNFLLSFTLFFNNCNGVENDNSADMLTMLALSNENSTSVENVDSTSTQAVAREVDTTPPEITAVAFEQSSYTAGNSGHIVFTATDDISGVTNFQGMCWTVESASGNTTLYPCGTVTSIGSDQYTISFDIGQYAESGTYYLKSYQLRDVQGNESDWYDADYTNTYYMGTSIPVASMTVQ